MQKFPYYEINITKVTDKGWYQNAGEEKQRMICRTSGGDLNILFVSEEKFKKIEQILKGK